MGAAGRWLGAHGDPPGIHRDPPGRRPRDLVFFVETSRGEYETHWINSMLVLDVTVPGEMEVALPAAEDEKEWTRIPAR